MKITAWAGALMACLLCIGGADARVRNVTDPQVPRALPADNSPVHVQWTDPAQFTEIRQSTNRWEAQRGDWVADLAKHFRKEVARRLPPGLHMDITITDIKRAGQYEPWRGPNMDSVRIIKDIYPPRLSFKFKLTAANGEVLQSGEEKLVDSAFMLNSTHRMDTDPLRYEKRMIDDWVRREFREQGKGETGRPSAHH